MLTRAKVFSLTIAALLVLTLVPGAPTIAAPPSVNPAHPPFSTALAPDHAQVTAALQSSPVMFIENVGQFADGARFQVRGGTGTMWLTEDAIWITVVERSQVDTLERFDVARANVEREDEPLCAVNLKLSFPGANPHPRLEPFNRLDTVVSYFIGNDPAKWHPNVPVWGGVRYKNLYPGIDLEITSEAGRWAWRMVARDASPLSLEGRGAGGEGVRLRVEGADTLTLHGGCLRLTTAAGDYTLPLLVADWSGLPAAIAGHDVLHPFASPIAFPAHQPTIRLPDHRNTRLQDNPSDLLYSTYLGGGARDIGQAIAVDLDGNAYVIGMTFSPDFPLSSPFQPIPGGIGPPVIDDVFVAKLDPTGSTLVYSTYLGGRGDDQGCGIAVDSFGNAYLTGETNSTNFPTANPFQGTNRGNFDAFIVKLNPTGSALVYSTYLGGSDRDTSFRIAVDNDGSAYVMGSTLSTDFPTANPFQDANRGNYDAFVAKLNPTGSALIYSTYLGGSGVEDVNGDGRVEYAGDIAVDNDGNAYVTGSTLSTDFPTANPLQPTSGGDSDAFVAKLNPTGSTLLYSTYLGGGDNDFGNGVGVDDLGNAYVTGSTLSTDFPTANPLQPSPGGDSDAFVAKLNSTGSTLVYSTYLGGSGAENSKAFGIGISRLNADIAVDNDGNAYVTGSTLSTDFPTANPLQPSPGGDSDAFVAKLNPTGSALVYSTYLGGNSGDIGHVIAVDDDGNAYVTGKTESTDFPTANPLQSTSGGGSDAFVAKLAVGGGGAVDLSVEAVTPVQVLEGQPLVRDKATAVRVVVSKTGNEPVDNVSVRLIYNSRDFTTFYVADSANMDANYSLVNDNSTYPLSFATSEVTKTMYFFGDSLTSAQAGQYVVTATVDYLGNITESNETNNSTSATANVYATSWPLERAGHFFQWLDIVYVKADWGETPTSEFDSYFNNSGAFLRGVFPVSASGFFPEKFATFSRADSTEYRGPDGRLDEGELREWFMNLNQRLILSRPYADAFVALLPRDWFQNYSTWCTSCTGLTYQPGTQLGLAQLSPYSGIAGYKTSAHELGHVFGLWLGCEQYQDCNKDNRKDDIGNPVYNGLWVEQRRLMHYSAEHRVYAFMGASADADFWIDAGDYGKLLNDHKVTGFNSTALGQGSSEEKAILVAGTLFDDGHIELEDWYVLSGAQTDELQPGDYYLRYLDHADQVLSELSFDLSLVTEGITVTQVPFIFRAPYVTATARIVIGEGTTDIVSRTVSAHAPVVTVVSPNGGERIDRSTTVSWTATDQDGDDLTFAVLYSPDGGTTWNALVTGLTTQTYEWDISGLSSGSSYLIKVMATDGFNTGQDVSNAPFAIIGKVYLPVILKNY